jgi:hypothetical protein
MATDPSQMPAYDNFNTGEEQRIRERAYQLWLADGSTGRKSG